MKPDDYEVGMTVAVTEFFGEIQYYRGPPVFDGAPLKIVGIALPFVALQDDRCRTLSLDVRLWGLTRVTSRSYVQAMRHKGGRCGKAAKARRDKGACPRCGGPHVAARFNPMGAVWIAVCKDCGWSGDPPGQRVEAP